MAKTSVSIVEKLIALAAHDGGNENEKIAAALRACDIIYREKMGITATGGDYNRQTSQDVGYEPSENDALKEFYRKIVLFNGKPREIICQRNIRCSLCKQPLKVGDITVWLPKTSYMFHPACWSKLKIKVAR